MTSSSAFLQDRPVQYSTEILYENFPFCHKILKRCVFNSQVLIKLIIFTASLLMFLSQMGFSPPSLTVENRTAGQVWSHCLGVCSGASSFYSVALQPSVQCQQSERSRCGVSTAVKIVFTFTGSTENLCFKRFEHEKPKVNHSSSLILLNMQCSNLPIPWIVFKKVCWL